MNINPIDLMLLVSDASVGASEVPPRSNRGPYVERVLAYTNTEAGNPWCASQFSRWGGECFKEAWPLPRSASVQALVNAAKARGLFYAATGRGDGAPRIGDGYVLWSKEHGRYAHIGLVIATGKGLAIRGRDGNTSGAGERDGWLAWEKDRVLTTKDGLIRWVNGL